MSHPEIPQRPSSSHPSSSNKQQQQQHKRNPPPHLPTKLPPQLPPQPPPPQLSSQPPPQLSSNLPFNLPQPTPQLPQQQQHNRNLQSHTIATTTQSDQTTTPTELYNPFHDLKISEQQHQQLCTHQNHFTPTTTSTTTTTTNTHHLTSNHHTIPLSNQFKMGGFLGKTLDKNSCLETVAKEAGIRFFLVAFSTLNTDSRTCLVPATAIKRVQKDGCRICLAMYYNVTAVDGDLALIPDPKTLIQLPWEPAVAWVMGDLKVDGQTLPQCPRGVLKGVVEKAAAMGYVMKAGVEPEFTLLDKEGTMGADDLDLRQARPHLETTALLRQQALLVKIHDVMELLEWGPYQIDHEAASCQFEINYGYTDCLSNADRFSFLKFMFKTLAEKEGVMVTFMPVPIENSICSNGLHINVSLWDVTGKTNLFIDTSSANQGTSKLCHHFIGGLLDHVGETCAIYCPTVNSYKRLNKACWCPNTKTWGRNNRTVMVRVPCDDRIEFRLGDGSSNPYLTHAFLLAAGLDGLASRTDPGRCTVTEVKNSDDYERMPKSLEAATNALEGSQWSRQWLGDALVDAFVAMKRRECGDHASHLSQFEKDYYLNC